MVFQKKFKSYSKQEALGKAQKYCTYQERCHSEVRTKLYEWNQRKNEAEEIISKLIESDFLNEERFAKVFAGGKFRIKKWGRNKIIKELKSKNVSEYCIENGLKEIDEGEYLKSLNKLLTQKKKQTSGTNVFEKKSKAANFLIGKGYEPELVWDILRGENQDFL